MIIKDGYWNYYVSFRINKTTFFKSFDPSKFPSGVAAVIMKDCVMKNQKLDQIFEERRAEVQHFQAQKDYPESKEELWSLYTKNSIPEMFFDFSEKLEDQLRFQVDNDIYRGHFYYDSYTKVLPSAEDDKMFLFVLLPLKIKTSKYEYCYCSVFVYLLTNGIGIIKLEIPIKDLKADEHFSAPLKRWFGEIKAWDSLFSFKGENKYKVIVNTEKEDDTSILDIMETLKNYMKNVFYGSIIDGDRITGLDTILISDSCDYNLNTASKSNVKCLDQIYRLAYPEETDMPRSNDALLKFWGSNHLDINGIHIVCGDRARIIIYADPNTIAKNHGREGGDCKYLQLSACGTLDPYIVLALAKKENEIIIYRIVNSNRHAIQEGMRSYYLNANYLDSFFLQSSKLGMDFYIKVRNMLEHFPVDFREALSNYENVEKIEQNKRSEKRESLLRNVTLLFTTFFGLPLIQQTYCLLKDIFISTSEIPIISVNNASIATWGIIILCLFYSEHKTNEEYYGIFRKHIK